MKSIVKVDKTTSLPFPKLMIAEECNSIVFFNKSEQGIIVHSSEKNEIGLYMDDWDMSVFSDFTGSVTLSN